MWLSMFMTSTMPIIQIVVMCAMGAVIARQASFAEVQLVSSAGSRQAAVASASQRSARRIGAAGNPPRSSQTTPWTACVLYICAVPDVHQACFLRRLKQSKSLVAPPSQHSSQHHGRPSDRLAHVYADQTTSGTEDACHCSNRFR